MQLLRPNLKATAQFVSGCAAAGLGLLLVVWLPKESLFAVRSGNTQIAVPEFIRADKYPNTPPTKIKDSFLLLAILLAGGSLASSIYIGLVVNARRLALDAEESEYLLQKALQKVDDESVIANRRLTNAADSEAMLTIYKEELARDFAIVANEKGLDFSEPEPEPVQQQIEQLPQPALLPSTTTEVLDIHQTTIYNPIDNLICSTGLAWGNQGAGKSWFVRHLAREKLKRGYRVIVFDPNSNKTSWKGLELYNTYSEIERMMRWYVKEVKAAYEEFCQSELSEEEWRKQIWDSGNAISIICEEATTYEDFIEDDALLSTFYKCGMTLGRKPEKPLTIVAHNNTQGCLGGRLKNMGNIIRRTQQIQLLTKTDLVTQQPTASGKALIKFDSSEEWVEIDMPVITEKITDFTPYIKLPAVINPLLKDSPLISLVKSDCPESEGVTQPLSDKVSAVVWTVRSVSANYPDSTPEQLFQSVLTAAQNGESVRDIIKEVLKCREGKDHKSRSYSAHGKTLLRWLIANYDDGVLTKQPQINEFLRS